jgi:hypothetical protein
MQRNGIGGIARVLLELVSRRDCINKMGIDVMKVLIFFVCTLVILSCSSPRQMIVKRDVSKLSNEAIKNVDVNQNQDSLDQNYKLMEYLLNNPNQIENNIEKVLIKYDVDFYKKYIDFVNDQFESGYMIIDEGIYELKWSNTLTHEIRIKSLDNDSKLWFAFFNVKKTGWKLSLVTRNESTGYPYYFDPHDDTDTN